MCLCLSKSDPKISSPHCLSWIPQVSIVCLYRWTTKPILHAKHRQQCSFSVSRVFCWGRLVCFGHRWRPTKFLLLLFLDRLDRWALYWLDSLDRRAPSPDLSSPKLMNWLSLRLHDSSPLLQGKCCSPTKKKFLSAGCLNPNLRQFMAVLHY